MSRTTDFTGAIRKVLNPENGPYRFYVTQVDQEVSQKGDDMWTMRVVSDGNENPQVDEVEVIERLLDTDETSWKLLSFLENAVLKAPIDFSDSNEQDWNPEDFNGVAFWADVDLDEYEGITRNTLGRYYPDIDGERAEPVQTKAIEMVG